MESIVAGVNVIEPPRRPPQSSKYFCNIYFSFQVSQDSIRTHTQYVLSALDPYTTYFIRVSCAYDVLVNHYEGNPFGKWSDPIETVTMAEGRTLGM